MERTLDAQRSMLQEMSRKLACDEMHLLALANHCGLRVTRLLPSRNVAKQAVHSSLLSGWLSIGKVHRKGRRKLHSRLHLSKVWSRQHTTCTISQFATVYNASNFGHTKYGDDICER
jgi:hypothetical protein